MMTDGATGGVAVLYMPVHERIQVRPEMMLWYMDNYIKFIQYDPKKCLVPRGVLCYV